MPHKNNVEERIEELTRLKEKIAPKLENTLRSHFNLAGISVSHGIALNEDGELDMSFGISDLNNPDNQADSSVIELAENKLKEWAPDNKPRVEGGNPPKFL